MENKYSLCDTCFEKRNEFEKLLWKRWIYFSVMQYNDQFYIINKCKWKDKNFIRKAFRNYFNKCWYISNCKNSLWEYWRLKL